MENTTSQQLRGVSAMAAAMFFLPMMDAIAKWLSTVDSMPPATVTLSRFVVQTLLTLLIIVALSGARSLKPVKLWGNMFRGLLMGIGSLCFFAAVKYMPLADAMAVFFVEPLMLTLLSALILKEEVGWRRRIAVAIGFVGTLIVIQPSWELFGWVSLLPLATATLFAFYLILNRRYGDADTPLVMQLYAGIGGTITVIIALVLGQIFGVSDMTLGRPTAGLSWLLLFAIGAIATGGHLLVVHASRLAPASLLAPFQYLEIVMAVIIGLVVFNEFPSASKWLGIAIIIGSGAYVVWREGKKRNATGAIAEEPVEQVRDWQ
ncbi:EamA domain-containing membrane protein RarD [Phyllobacterium sp. CL33Tsu]|uniref:DMT family transporter n=1 Tax=Phyllobacterium sp. CL33Tsu TaxID=1798191 RepID=UPI0008EC1223|nr:DMT family transporter [Phyllobacterium sp. CL33Tsu]SFJ11861.1 EamA domain-containing membrane protein RarD [Phyllobacterium sp. CL33Tsu]